MVLSASVAGHGAGDPQQFLRNGDDGIRFETEFPLEFLEWCRGAERVHPDDPTTRANVTFPPEGRGLFYRDTRSHVGWQHLISVFLRLVFEDVPRGHRDHTRLDTFSDQLL